MNHAAWGLTLALSFSSCARDAPAAERTLPLRCTTTVACHENAGLMQERANWGDSGHVVGRLLDCRKTGPDSIAYAFTAGRQEPVGGPFIVENIAVEGVCRGCVCESRRVSERSL